MVTSKIRKPKKTKLRRIKLQNITAKYNNKLYQISRVKNREILKVIGNLKTYRDIFNGVNGQQKLDLKGASRKLGLSQKTLDCDFGKIQKAFMLGLTMEIFMTGKMNSVCQFLKKQKD